MSITKENKTDGQTNIDKYRVTIISKNFIQKQILKLNF